MCLSFNCIKLWFWLAVQNKGVFQGPHDPSVIEQRTPQARPEHSLVPFFPLWCWDLEPSQHFQMTVTCCAAVYPPRMLWSLACCCKSDRHLTTSQWQNRSCEGEGDLFIYPTLWMVLNATTCPKMNIWKRTFGGCHGAGQRVKPTEYRKYRIDSICYKQKFMCMCWCFTWSNFAYFPNKIMQIKLWCKQAPEKCKQIAASLPITSANCLSLKINPPKLAPFAP